jgi:hypothetical protein
MTTASTPRRSPLARLAEGYWAESRQPLASLVFIAPLLVVYEAGVLVLGPERVRNGADAWLRWLLERLGFGQYFLLPILTVCLLLAWHHTTRRPWRLSGRIFYGMAGECVLLAICLRLLSQLQGMLLEILADPTFPAGEAGHFRLSIGARIGDAVGFLGAGIYEELLFRLILLSLVVWGLGRLKAQPRTSMVAGVLLTSFLFAAAHYVGPSGYELDCYSFFFRFLAGVFFSILFLYRGFGIAAGAHAGYDILVGLGSLT